MANEEQLKILKSGVKEWNRWRKANPEIRIDLVGADLTSTRLREANLSNAKLIETIFWGADCTEASFRESNLYGAKLSISNLTKADLSKAYLRASEMFGTDLSMANLTEADLYGAYLRGGTQFGTSFKQVQLGLSVFADLDLRGVKHLEQVVHLAPSEISLSTIFRSNGQIPHKFLRDAGIPENFITYMSSLTGKAFEYFSAFISYTEADDAISKRLYADLQAAGLRVWRWREDAKWGAPIEKNIDQAVRIYDKLIVICSEDSLKAPAVIDEIDRALQKENQLMKAGKVPEVLFPITIDDYIFDEWEHYLKPKVMAKTVGDFRNWSDPEKYDAALDRLIDALKQEEE